MKILLITQSAHVSNVKTSDPFPINVLPDEKETIYPDYITEYDDDEDWSLTFYPIVLHKPHWFV